MKQITEFFKQHWLLFLLVTGLNLFIATRFMVFIEMGTAWAIIVITLINIGTTLLIAEALKKWKGGKK